MTDIVPVTDDCLDDLADLFESNGATRGCWCMLFIVPRPDYYRGRRGGNRERFEAMARTADPPMGLLAYREGIPIGWCSVGPRSRYPVALSPRALLKRRDPTEDEDVWLVPCFFVRVGFRRVGATEELLTAAVELAASRGAKAIEGWPIADDYKAPTSFEAASTCSRSAASRASHALPRGEPSCAATSSDELTTVAIPGAAASESVLPSIDGWAVGVFGSGGLSFPGYKRLGVLPGEASCATATTCSCWLDPPEPPLASPEWR